MSTGRALVPPTLMLLFSIIAADVPFVLASALCGTVLLLLLWVTATGREAWPFSSYPMFSTYRSGDESQHYQVLFVLADGRRVAPLAALADLTDEFSRSYRRLGDASNVPAARALRVALVSRVAAVSLRLDPTLDGVTCVEVWERSVQFHGNRAPACLDRCVAQFAPPLPSSEHPGV